MQNNFSKLYICKMTNKDMDKEITLSKGWLIRGHQNQFKTHVGLSPSSLRRSLVSNFVKNWRCAKAKSSPGMRRSKKAFYSFYFSFTLVPISNSAVFQLLLIKKRSGYLRWDEIKWKPELQYIHQYTLCK